MIRFALLLFMSLAVSSQATAAVKWNNSSTSSGKPSVKFPFVPDEITSQFNELSKQHKMEICGFQNYRPKWDEIDKDLAQKIKG